MADGKSPHTPEYCLARAVQCEELAQQTKIPATKATFLDIAKRWRTLAAESERPLVRLVGRGIGSPKIGDDT